MISIVPFAEQVTVGKTLLDRYNVSDEHDTTHCVTFDDADFRKTDIAANGQLKRMAYFDSSNSGWTANDMGICDRSGNREVIPWQTDATKINERIEKFYADGWTSIDIGTKWGVTMLDPSSQSALTALTVSGVVDAEADGQPFAYNRTNSMKILVVMSDGANTYQRAVEDEYRSGNSPLFFNSRHSAYSYYDAERDHNGKAAYWREGDIEKTGYYRSCNYYGCRYVPYTYTETVTGWFDSVYGNQSDNHRMSWAEVWADMTIYKFAYEFVSPAKHNGSHGYASTYYNKILREIGSKSATGWNGNEKNDNTSDICTAAKEKGILIFTIGMDTNDPTADMALEDCASLPTYYYDVQSLDISNAFASIALQINQLRLTQ